jgi:hypothetical protein
MHFWPIFRMGPTGCSETSLRNYDYSLCNSPEERSSQPIMTMTMTVTMTGQSTDLLQTIIWSVSIGQDILPILWKPEVYYRVHNSPLLHSYLTRLISCTDFWYRHLTVSVNPYRFLLSEQTQHYEHYAHIYCNMFRPQSGPNYNNTNRKAYRGGVFLFTAKR